MPHSNVHGRDPSCAVRLRRAVIWGIGTALALLFGGYAALILANVAFGTSSRAYLVIERAYYFANLPGFAMARGDLGATIIQSCVWSALVFAILSLLERRRSL